MFNYYVRVNINLLWHGQNVYLSLSLSLCRKWAVVFSHIKSSSPTLSSAWTKIQFSQQMRWVSANCLTHTWCYVQISLSCGFWTWWGLWCLLPKYSFELWAPTKFIGRLLAVFSSTHKTWLVDMEQLGIPQCVSPQPAGAAATIKYVLQTPDIQVCTPEVDKSESA